MIKKNFTEPVIDVLLFDEDDVVSLSGEIETASYGVTANEDVLAQINKVLVNEKNGNSSVTSIRLEDINTRSN